MQAATEEKTSAEPLIIEQDHEAFDGDIGSPMDVYWSRGHGHDADGFVRAVVEHCIYDGRAIPRIPEDARPAELWQRNVPSGDCITYHRYKDRPAGRGAARGMFAVTLLDLDARRTGATKCSVSDCNNPWQVGQPIAVKVDTDSDYLAVTVWLCREHRSRMPEPSYRMCLIPLGATISLPAPSES